MTKKTTADLRAAIRNVPDFPKPGIQFKDITPVLADSALFSASIDLLVDRHRPGQIDTVVGIDARGFIFASAVALRLNAGFVPVRKQGKLPFNTHEQRYDLEYGSNTIAIQTDAVKPGSRVLLIDDRLATGGTAEAAALLLQRVGAIILEAAFLIELKDLRGRDRIQHCPVRSLVVY